MMNDSDHWDEIIESKVKDVSTRTPRKRGWVVLRKSWLTSSINYEMTLAEIAVFSKLIVMADEFGPVPGLISDNDCRAMPHEYLAHLACCPLDLFESTLKKGMQNGSIYENGHGIFLTHFDEYQFTEYDRQKPYRQGKRPAQVDPAKYTLGPMGRAAAENRRIKLAQMKTEPAGEANERL
jgi:hypothetical protein